MGLKIRCKSCGHEEEVNVKLIVKIIGGALPAGGFYAWVTYLLAGTGLALPIVTALIAGGTAILAFSDEITQWIIEKAYKCEKCGNSNWEQVIS